MRSTPRNSRKTSQDIQVCLLYFIVLKQITPTIFPLEHPTQAPFTEPWMVYNPWIWDLISHRCNLLRGMFFFHPMKLIHWPSRNAGCFFPSRGKMAFRCFIRFPWVFFVIWGLGLIKRPHSSSMSSWCISIASVVCCRSKSYMHCLSGCRFVEI